MAHDYTSSTWVQTPPCGYAVSNNFSWDGASATTAITVDASSSVAALSIFSTKKSDAGTYPIKLSNTLTIANNGPGGNTVFTPATDADKTVFTITIVDPCVTATIDALTFSGGSISVQDGQTATTTFSVAGNSVMTAQSTTSALCLGSTIEIYSDASDTAIGSWAALSGPIGGVYTITIDTKEDLTLIDDEASVTKTVYVKQTLSSYTSQIKRNQLTVTITQAGCDCSHLAWVNPSADTSATIAVGASSTLTVPVPTADDSAKTTVPEFQKCILSSPCAETGHFKASTGVTFADGT